VFAMPETGIGLFPDVGGGWFLPRLGPALGMWLALTGERLKGGDVCAAGVATNFVESEVLDAVKSQVCDGGLALLEAMDWDESAAFEKQHDLIDRCFWKQSVEDIFIALETEETEWASKQLATLKTKSPQTLKVAHRQLRAGLELKTFEDNMRMEFRIGCRQVHSHDFQEGVRAVIVDKDNKPQWSPSSLAGVTPRMLDAIFAPLDEDELTFD
jgi:enoyl-CoA hydratase